MVNKTKPHKSDLLDVQQSINTDALASVEPVEDVVEYTLRCVQALAPSLSKTIADAAESHVRAMFGGDEVWIGKRRDHSDRNRAIVRDYIAGERLALLSRRYGLSERRILQIIKA